MGAEGTWERVKIQSLIDIGVITAHKDGNYGSNYPKKSEFGTTGVPLLTAKLLQDSGGRIDFDAAPRLANEKAEKLTYGFIEANDVLLSHNATIGRVAVVPELKEDVLIGTSLTYYRLNKDQLLPQYLAAFFAGVDFQNQLAAVMSHSTRNQVPITAQRQLSIILPPLSEQKAIASILGSLDDKIELNRRMNETLESMARAIFKSWFVDFDPVRAKMDGRQPAGMDQATANLFPDAFEDSPLGQIPAGWSAAPFKKHVTVERGLSYKGSGLSDSGVPMHNLNSILEGGGYKYAGIKFYAGDYKEKHVVVPGDLIVTNTEQGFNHLLIGHAAIVPEQFGAMGIFSHHIYRVRLIEDSPLSPQYFVHLINMRRWHELIAGFSNGTTINMLPKDALEKPMLIEPPKELVSKFTDFANTSAQRTEHSVVQNARLAILRDTLLPKLLSGELRVKDAEKAVSSAL